jgi:hypothetical protein
VCAWEGTHVPHADGRNKNVRASRREHLCTMVRVEEGAGLAVNGSMGQAEVCAIPSDKVEHGVRCAAKQTFAFFLLSTSIIVALFYREEGCWRGNVQHGRMGR